MVGRQVVGRQDGRQDDRQGWRAGWQAVAEAGAEVGSSRGAQRQGHRGRGTEAGAQGRGGGWHPRQRCKQSKEICGGV